MAGTKAGGIKAAATNKRKYGSDFYKINGRKGGQNGHTGGFAGRPDLAREAGRKGGRNSVRGRMKPEKRKNIECPKLNEMALNVIKGTTKMMELHSVRPMGLNFKARRQKKEVFEKLYKFANDEDWIAYFAFLEMAGLQKLLDHFRIAVNKLDETPIETFEMASQSKAKRRLTQEEVDALILSKAAVGKVRKAFEWTTGRSFDTGEKIHRGFVDEAEAVERLMKW